MIQTFLFILILLLPVTADAGYKVYLKNGSLLSGVSSIEKKPGEVIIYFGRGSISISEKDILKIEEIETLEKDVRSQEIPEQQEKPAEAAVPIQRPEVDKSARVNALKADLEAMTSEIKTVEEQEARTVAEINEKRGRRYKYNIYQLRQLEKEIEPLQQELFTIQQKKGELLQRRAYIEGELKSLE